MATAQLPRQERKFHRLAEKWKRETAHLSNVATISMHPSYQQIIGMGPDAIPLILSELRASPDHWFWALRSITGVDPVPDSSRGKMKQMARHWLAWGKKQGHVR